ncbi:glycosyltransferase family 4 protein [Chlamydiota bacterium]
MRIVIDIQPLLHERTGIGHYIYNCVNSLQEIDTKNDYVLHYFNFLKKNPPIAIINEQFILKRSSLIPGRLLEKYWKYTIWPGYDFFSGGADIFHFPNFIIHPVKRAKAFVTIHDLSFKVVPEFTEPRNLRYLSSCIESTLERADHILTDSVFIKNQIITEYHYSKEKISVVPLGVAPHFKRITDHTKRALVKKKYALPDDIILYVGTVEPRKNLATLFEAFSSLKNNPLFKHTKIIIAGMKGWLLDYIYRPLMNSGIEDRVIFTGYVPDEEIPVLMSLAKVFVFPSFYEGFGLPPLEAMACGVPVISSNSASLPEILGDNALFFDPHSPQQLAEMMVTLYQDMNIYTSFQEKGLAHFKRYDWKFTGEKLMRIYETN